MKKYFIVFLLSLQVFSVLAQDVKKAKPIALFTIDGKPTYTSEFIYLYKKNHPNKQQDYTLSKVDEYLNLFINFKLKITEAQRRGLDTTAKFNKELKTYRDELKKPYRTEKDVLDKVTHETYDHLTQEVSASHILIQLKPEATPTDTLQEIGRASCRERV